MAQPKDGHNLKLVEPRASLLACHQHHHTDLQAPNQRSQLRQWNKAVSFPCFTTADRTGGSGDNEGSPSQNVNNVAVISQSSIVFMNGLMFLMAFRVLRWCYWQFYQFCSCFSGEGFSTPSLNHATIEYLFYSSHFFKRGKRSKAEGERSLKQAPHSAQSLQGTPSHNPDWGCDLSQNQGSGA